MRIALAGKSVEFFDSALHVIIPGNVLEVVANLLVQAFSHGAELLPGALGYLLINGESDVHEHSIRAHILCVKYCFCTNSNRVVAGKIR